MNNYEFAKELFDLVTSGKTLWLTYNDNLLVKLSKDTDYTYYSEGFMYIMVDDCYDRCEYFGDVYEDLGDYQLKKIINYNEKEMTWEYV